MAFRDEKKFESESDQDYHRLDDKVESPGVVEDNKDPGSPRTRQRLEDLSLEYKHDESLPTEDQVRKFFDILKNSKQVCMEELDSIFEELFELNKELAEQKRMHSDVGYAGYYERAFKQILEYMEAAELDEELQSYSSSAQDLIKSLRAPEKNTINTECQDFLIDYHRLFGEITAMKLSQAKTGHLDQDAYRECKEKLDEKLAKFISKLETAIQEATDSKSEHLGRYKSLLAQIRELKMIFEKMRHASSREQILAWNEKNWREIQNTEATAAKIIHPFNLKLKRLGTVFNILSQIRSTEVLTLAERENESLYKAGKLAIIVATSIPLTPLSIAQLRGLSAVTVAEENAARAFFAASSVISPAMTVAEKTKHKFEPKPEPQPSLPLKTRAYNALKSMGNRIAGFVGRGVSSPAGVVNAAAGVTAEALGRTAGQAAPKTAGRISRFFSGIKNKIVSGYNQFKAYAKKNPVKAALMVIGGTLLVGGALAGSIFLLGPLPGVGFVVGTAFLAATGKEAIDLGREEVRHTQQVAKRMQNFEVVFDEFKEQRRTGKVVDSKFCSTPAKLAVTLGAPKQEHEENKPKPQVKKVASDVYIELTEFKSAPPAAHDPDDHPSPESGYRMGRGS